MAQAIKRNWALAVLLAATILFVSTWNLIPHWTRPEVRGQESQPEQSPALDAQTYLGVAQLRRELCLSNENLAAIGCTQQLAEQVLQSLLSWYEANSASLADARATERTARRSFHEAMRRINIGPRDEQLISQVPDLEAGAGAAEAQYAAVLDGAVAQINALLSAEQADVWAIARANADAPGRYRYVRGLTDQQKALLRRALLVAPKDRGDLLHTVEQQVLSSSQRTAREAATQAATQSLEEVLMAEDVVLPLPEALDEPAGER